MRPQTKSVRKGKALYIPSEDGQTATAVHNGRYGDIRFSLRFNPDGERAEETYRRPTSGRNHWISDDEYDRIRRHGNQAMKKQAATVDQLKMDV